MAFGFPLTKKYRITFDYYAHGRLYSDELQSDVAIPQNTRIPLTYNPEHPEQNSRTNNPVLRQSVRRQKSLPFAVAGSLVLLLTWLLYLRGCL